MALKRSQGNAGRVCRRERTFTFRFNRRRTPMAAFQPLLSLGRSRKFTTYNQLEWVESTGSAGTFSIEILGSPDCGIVPSLIMIQEVVRFFGTPGSWLVRIERLSVV